MKFIFTTLLVCVIGKSFSQTLNPDNAFGNAGIVTTNLANNAPHFTYASGQQSNGKIIIGGSSLIRLSQSGFVDSSFGTNGMAIKSDFPDVNTLAVQTDDKIVCAFNGYSEVLIKRFTADGLIDSSFNGTGIAILTEPGKLINISKLRIQKDGKILLVGSSTGTKTSFFIARYLSDGTADVSFNNTGVLTLDISPEENIAYDIAEQSTGKLIVGGSAKANFIAERHLALVRLNSDGSRDINFNGTGLVEYSNLRETALLLNVYADDRILVAGTSGNELLLMRFLGEGTADNNFNSDGLHTAAGLGISLPRQINVLEDSSVIITGQSSVTDPSNWEYAAFKFDKNGEPDVSFNGSGFSSLPAPGNDNCAGAVLLTDGSIVVAGYNDNLVIANTAKISDNGIFDVAYGTNGINYLNINGTDETVYTLLKQSTNKLIAIGEKTDLFATALGTTLVRYTTTGSIDSSFATNGILNIVEPGFVFHSAILQPNDKILLLGDKYGNNPAQSGLCLIRINSDGSIDNNFADNGLSLVGPGNTSGRGKGLGLLSNGNIMVTGKDPVNSDLIVLYRLLSNGTIDNSFATNGKKTIDPGLAENGLGAMTIQPDDKILLGGYIVQNNGQSFFFCMRLQSNGEFDAGFANNGTYRTGTSTSDFIELNSVLLAPDNKILLTGHVISPTDRTGSVCVIRLLATGAADNSFNGTGQRLYYKKLNSDSTFNFPNAVAIHPDSSIYIIGDAFNSISEHERFIIRIKQNSVLDSTISTEGTGWYYMSPAGLSGTLNDLIVNPDSSIFVAGNREVIGSNKDFLLASYKRLPDTVGITYIFNGNGLWTDAANWLNAAIPPTLLPNGATILVDPVITGSSILNVEQNIAPGGRFIVRPGKKLLVEGNFKIGN